MEEYNGWKNRETWLVNLWITNDEEVCVDAWACKNVDALQEFIKELIEKQTAIGLAYDLATYALCFVDYERIYEVMHEEDCAKD